MTQETAAQNISNQLKSSFENKMMEEFKKKPMHELFYWGLERLSVEKKNSWYICAAQA